MVFGTIKPFGRIEELIFVYLNGRTCPWWILLRSAVRSGLNAVVDVVWGFVEIHNNFNFIANFEEISNK